MFKKISQAHLIIGATLVLVVGVSVALYFVEPPKRRHPVSVQNVTQISAWMTFEYINSLFDIPPALLKDALKVENAKYPLITLKQYAKKSNKDIDSVVSDVQKIVQTYLEHKPQE